jgi:hypothetical protein
VVGFFEKETGRIFVFDFFRKTSFISTPQFSKFEQLSSGGVGRACSENYFSILVLVVLVPGTGLRRYG